MQNIVLKFGTSVVSASDGSIAKDRLSALINSCSKLIQQKKKILIVSSGAIGLGRSLLKIKKTDSLADRQAAAAVGQGHLMRYYSDEFSKHGILVAQVLVTAEDFSKKESFENLKRTLQRLLDLNVVPILNENDCVSTREIEFEKKSFGDNDSLSAIIATKLNAELLILLSDVDAVYTENPKKNAEAIKLKSIESLEELGKIQTQGKSDSGRGGMSSKLQAAKIALLGGVEVVVASGFEVGVLESVFSEKKPGTWLKINTQKKDAKNKKSKSNWIAVASGYKGFVVVNLGAEEALKKGASLLAVGVSAVGGTFARSAVVSVQNEKGEELGRGVSFYSSSEMQKMKGMKSSDIKRKMGNEFSREVIHRDNLVLFL